MDHGLDIETPGPRRTCCGSASGSTSRRWPPTTCTTRYADDADAHEVLLCVQSGSTMADPKRFKFDARDFYLKSRRARCARCGTPRCPAPATRRWRSPSGSATTPSVFASRNLMPQFPVPDGRDRGVLAAQGGRCAGWTGASRAACPRATGSRPSTSSTSSARWASRATSWSTPTSCRTPSGRASGSARAVARRPAR